VFNTEQKVAGIISNLVSNGLDYDGGDDPAGVGNLDGSYVNLDKINADPTSSNEFLPINKRLFGVDSLSLLTLEDFLYQGSIDDILDHFASSRFIAGPTSDLTSFTFQNRTKIKSMLVFVNVDPGEFNYSNNPTYTTEAGQIIARNDDGVRPFSYITKVGLYDADNNLLAVASLSRPIVNTPGSKQLIRIRLDF
jgi:hypothetical protein